MKIEKLTDEEREWLGATWRGTKVLRSIDAHEAVNAHMSANIAALKHDHEAERATWQSDRAALVEQAAMLKRERDEARRNPVPVVALSLHEARIQELTAEIAQMDDMLQVAGTDIMQLRAEVARLTSERDEARATLRTEQQQHAASMNERLEAQAEVARLTEALKEAEAYSCQGLARADVTRLTSERDEAREQARRFESAMNDVLNMQSSARAWQAEVTRLTQERDEARALATGYRQSAKRECAEVARLTRERDEARAQAKALRAEGCRKDDTIAGLERAHGTQYARAEAERAEVVRLTSERDEWQKAGASVGVDCPGAMQQAKHMAVAACSALGLCYVETAPSDIREAVARLTEERDGWLRAVGRWRELEADVARLTEALAAAERSKSHWKGVCDESDHDGMAWKDRAEAERAEVARLTEVLAAECKASSEHYARAEAAEQKLAAAENDRDENARAWASNQRRAEAAEQKLAAAERRAQQGVKRAEAAEQKLAAAEQRYQATEQHIVMVREQRDAVEARCLELEQKLAAAELDREESERLLEVKMRERDVAEARVRELDADLTAAMQRIDRHADRTVAAESELAKLRERVRELEEFAAPLYNGESEARIALESELAQLREELRTARLDPVTRVCEAADELRARANRGQ